MDGPPGKGGRTIPRLAAARALYENPRMPTGADRLAAFLHPVTALAALALLAWAASLGLRSRERGGAALRARHARLAPSALGAMLFSFAFGAASTWLWRRDLELASGFHFWLGVGISLLLVATALLSRRVPHDATARRLHPALGMLALLLAALQVFFGLGLVPL